MLMVPSDALLLCSVVHYDSGMGFVDALRSFGHIVLRIIKRPAEVSSWLYPYFARPTKCRTRYTFTSSAGGKE